MFIVDVPPSAHMAAPPAHVSPYLSHARAKEAVGIVSDQVMQPFTEGTYKFGDECQRASRRVFNCTAEMWGDRLHATVKAHVALTKDGTTIIVKFSDLRIVS